MPTKAKPPGMASTITESKMYGHWDALEQLRGLVKTRGMLKVITADHACAGGPQPKTGEQLAACAAHPVSIKHPHHQVLHDVVRIEGPDDRGRMVAGTAEGDWTVGYPADLLRRLLQHITEGGVA